MSPQTDLADARLVDRVILRHDADELTWVASGSCTLMIGGRRWQADTAHALLVPAGREHTVVPRPDSLVFPLIFPEGLGASEVSLIPRTPALDSCVRVLLQSGLASDSSVAAARRTIRALVGGSGLHDSPALPVDTRALEVATGLLAHPATPLDLEGWARRVHTSSKTLQRCFRRDTGMTFPQWRTRARLSAARERLERGDDVARVARAVGYASPSAFITAFRERYGLTPGDYRSRARIDG